jgi:membrane-associated phospholipid phosphatase
MMSCIEEAQRPCESDEIGPYALSGPQVEPGASYWLQCPVPRPIPLDELIRETGPGGRFEFPDFPRDPAVVQDEFRELVELERLRFDPNQVPSTMRGRERCPISTFLQLRPQPLGAVYGFARGNEFPPVFNGAELARYFENETPGLAHRHALNLLIRDSGSSPPRQALVWAALDVALYTALSAAWYYKWLDPRTSRRERPWEYAQRNGCRLNVLFDRPVNGLGTDSVDDLVSYADPSLPRLERNGRRPNFHPAVGGFLNTSPGTPRHPAYPSGHSTYAGAASEILSFFFPDYRQEFDRLADNAGIARLWAGIHWRSDHVNGVQLGRSVACLIIEQLRRSGIPLVPGRRPCNDTPPEIERLERERAELGEICGRARGCPVPRATCVSTSPCPPDCRDEADGASGTDTRGQSFVG